MRTHENLEVWKKSVDIAIEIYKATENFPQDEKFGLTSQIRCASISIPANIAEGAARNSNKEFLCFLSISQGSASEVATEILIASRLGFLDTNIYADLIIKLNDIGKMIGGLSNYLRTRDK